MILHKLKTDNFTMIDNKVIRDKRLSWKAKGILVYLLSRQEGWRVQVSDIMQRSTDREVAVRSALRELRRYGYAKLEDIREGGRIVERRFTICEDGGLIDPYLLNRENLNEEILNREILQLNKTGEENKTEKETKTEKDIMRAVFRPPQIKDVLAYGTEIGLNAEACQEFVDHHTTRGWWLARGVKMKDWKAAMRTWKRMQVRFAQQQRKPTRADPKQEKLDREFDEAQRRYGKE